MSSSPPSPFLARFREQAGKEGCMSFERFMQLALFDPELGYYRGSRPRVGTGEGTDFFTSSSSGTLFGELVCAGCASILRGAGEDPSRFNFVEIGAEEPGGILRGLDLPFASSRCLHLGEPLVFSGPCVVFSNELFDSQPCRRFVRRGGGWLELGVREVAGALFEVEVSGPVVEDWLPVEASEGCYFDAPRAALALAEEIASQDWRGLFIALDYGKHSAELVESCPQGTVRAYHRHRQVGDLYARPGEQDLTCHVCWDWLQGALAASGFGSTVLQSQESFFVKHAGEYVSRTISEEAPRASQRKLALLQLLHPGNLGHKFQALHALRA